MEVTVMPIRKQLAIAALFSLSSALFASAQVRGPVATAALSAANGTSAATTADVPRQAIQAQQAKNSQDETRRLQLDLVRAAEQDDAEAVAALLKKHVDPDSAFGDGSTALHWAAYSDNVALVKLLLHSGAKVQSVTRLQKLTPLHMAAESGDAELINTLLDAGAKADEPNETGTTPLMIASASGNTAAVTTLLAHGANVNAREKTYGQTPLFFAAARNRADVLRLLLSKGADPKVKTSVSKLARINVGPDGEILDDNKRPAPAGAKPEAAKAESAKPDVAGLEAAKSSTAAKADDAAKAPDAAKPDDKAKDAYGFSAADSRKRVFGANQMGGLSALLIAARDGQSDAVKALLDAGDDINQTSDTDHATPLILAVINGHYDTAKLILDRGADTKLANTDGATALFGLIDVQWSPHTWYAQPVVANEDIGYLDLVSALLDRGADPNAPINKKLWFRSFANDETWFDVEGATPYLRAAMAGDLAAMKLLVARGANPNIATKSADTPLMAAAGVGWAAYWTSNAPYSRLDAVKFCLDHGAVVDAKDAKGYSALHGAAFRGDSEMVKFLIAKGADVHAKTKDGDTVADLANGLFEHAVVHPETVALLEQLGSVNSHNCRSNECVVPTKEDKPVVAKAAPPVAAQSGKTPSATADKATEAQPSANNPENRQK
jgi:ankyrin repeat protein